MMVGFFFATLRRLRAPIVALAIIGSSATAQVSSVGLWTYAPVPNSVKHPKLVNPTFSPVSRSQDVSFTISLQPRDLAGLHQFVESVSKPNSPMYRHFITPQEVGRLFGPAQTDIDTTVKFLKSQGLTVKGVSANGFVVSAGGTAQQVESAFRTSLENVSTFDARGNPWNFRTNVTPIQMPSSVAGRIVSIDGIDNSGRCARGGTTTQLDPVSMRVCYGTRTNYVAGFYGQGVNIAIANWDGFRLDNVPYWTSLYDMPLPAAGAGSNVNVVQVDTGPWLSGTTPYGEGDLDIQSVLMGSPLANIYVYDSSQADIDSPIPVLSQISTDNIADIVSESWAWSEPADTCTAAYDLHLSMTAQGITYMACAGDWGTQFVDPENNLELFYPDIDPNVLSVGGSIATVNAFTGERVVEKSWGFSSSDGYGGGGGFDPVHNAAAGFAFNVSPSYQTSAIPSLTNTYGYRLFPDIASFSAGQDGLGNNDGSGWAMLIFYNEGAGSNYPPGSTVYFDGTSIASPATAGNLGAVLTKLFVTTTPTASRSNVRVGRIQDLLYANGSNPDLFYDITTGDSIGILQGTSTAAIPGPGWDFATGWGALNFLGLYDLLLPAVQ